MRSKRTLWVVAATPVLLISAVGVGAVTGHAQGAAVLAEIVRDPLAAFGQRSPGPRQPGALFQTKPSIMALPQALVAPLAPARPQVQASGLVPPWTQAGDNLTCERLTRPVAAVALAPASPEVERLAGQLVAAVQQALADNKTNGQPQREDAVEQGIESALENSAASPEVASAALGVVQARLVALGVNCAPGVPQAMRIASAAATEAAKPNDLQPSSIGQPAGTGQPSGPVSIGFPPPSGGGGGGGGTTHPFAQ
jgi:hypothetical protein